MYHSSLSPINPRARRAFTLIELILVMGILVMVMSLAVPMVTRTLGRQSLKQGADRVRIAMGKARVEAIRTGEIHALFFQAQGNWLNVGKFDQIAAQADLASTELQRIERTTHTGYEENLLPKGIRFISADLAVDSRADQALGGANVNDDSIQPVLFYPDGTAQDALIYLQDDKQNILAVELRGLTGSARTVRIQQSR